MREWREEWRKVSVGDAVERRESTEYHCHGTNLETHLNIPRCQ